MRIKNNEENTRTLTKAEICAGWAAYKAAWRIFKEVYGEEPVKGSDTRKALASMRHALFNKRAYPSQDENMANVEAFVTQQGESNVVAARIFNEEIAKSKTKASGVKAAPKAQSKGKRVISALGVGFAARKVTAPNKERKALKAKIARMEKALAKLKA